jgi:molybdenum cofactor cytidylyltransferase
MGVAKQLLPYRGGTLVEHAARTAIGSGATEIVVVVGSRAEAVRRSLQGLELKIVENPDWQNGMGTSIACGVSALGESIEAAVIALADQPRITSGHLRTLAAQAQPVAASLYDGVLGAPCGFARSEFPRLRGLTGDQGARHLLRNGEIPAEAVLFEPGLLDLDTPEAYESFVTEDLE